MFGSFLAVVSQAPDCLPRDQVSHLQVSKVTGIISCGPAPEGVDGAQCCLHGAAPRQRAGRREARRPAGAERSALLSAFREARGVIGEKAKPVLVGPYITTLAQAAVGENGPVFGPGLLGAVTAKAFFFYCLSASVFLQVLVLPLLGAIADYTSLKKRLLVACSSIGAGATCLLFFVGAGLGFRWGGALFALANLVISGESEAAVSKEAVRVADWCTGLITRFKLPLEVLGPAPCPLTRIKDRWRYHVLVRGASEEIGKLVRYAAPRITRAKEVRVIIDRDPVSLL